MRDQSNIRLVRFEGLLIGEEFFHDRAIWIKCNMTSAKNTRTKQVHVISGIPSKTFVIDLTRVKVRDPGLYGRMFTDNKVTELSLAMDLPKKEADKHLTSIALCRSLSRDADDHYGERIEYHHEQIVGLVVAKLEKLMVSAKSVELNVLKSVVALCYKTSVEAKTTTEFFIEVRKKACEILGNWNELSI